MHCKKSPIYVFFFWELRGLSPNFQFLHSCVCERFISSQDLSTYFKQQNRQIDCAIPFLGIFVSNFRYLFFGVYTKNESMTIHLFFGYF
jgi:hypothetical protein